MMDKGEKNPQFDFDEDPDFSENFYKNIEKVLRDELSDINDAEDESADTRDEVINESTATYNLDIIGDDVVTEMSTEDKALASAKESEEINDEGTASDITDTDKLLDSDTSNVDGQEADTGHFKETQIADEIDEELDGINASLAQQICFELDTQENANKQAPKKKMPKWMKIQGAIIICLICLLGVAFFLGFTKPGNKLLLKMGVNIGGKVWEVLTDDIEEEPVYVEEDLDFIEEDDLVSDAVEVDPELIEWPFISEEGRHEDYAYNILLLGEEAIGSGSSRGRTDLVIIATLNTKTKKLRLTSLMRDMLVQIPGYQDNKLNSAYEKGGVKLLYETIALNFDIRLDGCIKVGFEDFEKIIDRLGGLDIELTKAEAKYLNNTNYISNKKYRNVVEGMNHMNGNQVLGYSRVRKRKTITGNNNDYGRTDRHRIVLNAIFEKYKTSSKLELLGIMLSVLPTLDTDIDKENFEFLLNTFIEMGTFEIEQLRIPADGTFTDNVKVRGMDVLIPDKVENVKLLHEFIFGE